MACWLTPFLSQSQLRPEPTWPRQAPPPAPLPGAAPWPRLLPSSEHSGLSSHPRARARAPAPLSTQLPITVTFFRVFLDHPDSWPSLQVSSRPHWGLAAHSSASPAILHLPSPGVWRWVVRTMMMMRDQYFVFRPRSPKTNGAHWPSRLRSPCAEEGPGPQPRLPQLPAPHIRGGPQQPRLPPPANCLMCYSLCFISNLIIIGVSQFLQTCLWHLHWNPGKANNPHITYGSMDCWAQIIPCHN